MRAERTVSENQRKFYADTLKSASVLGNLGNMITYVENAPKPDGLKILGKEYHTSVMKNRERE
jgi:hypothetical protein